MLTNLNASELRLKDVQQLFKFEEQFNDLFTSLLFLENLTEFEQQELQTIRNLFREYYSEGKISEGQIKFLFLAPLLKLAGFYHPSIKITLEENIADISVEDEDTLIKGRMDILAVNKTQGRTISTPFWILVIESKNSSLNASEGLPQLLTYAHTSLEHQTSVWGLTSNGMDYQFVYIQQGNPPTYQVLPKLDITRAESSSKLLQVLKAICLQYNAQ
ncbi:restriction endonuclease subunit R [Brasilonema sp. UFV-L1]|uniref:restriction endonuclease subunit R n=1 Tax=Brasilonema sp. UFV-L1 TaxID=2234130 RepID=UPI00145E562B|nr:restriction endonuclease subunit R [Brasilonema sp. UFV-L1]NMG08517.1 restriction endonuclease subunit R [Brasilonema sp. UFV-L1]